MAYSIDLRECVVTFVREREQDINNLGEKAPAIDSIEVAELESPAEAKEWLQRKAPGFLRMK